LSVHRATAHVRLIDCADGLVAKTHIWDQRVRLSDQVKQEDSGGRRKGAVLTNYPGDDVVLGSDELDVPRRRSRAGLDRAVADHTDDHISEYGLGM
jgi:hypothetical protein